MPQCCATTALYADAHTRLISTLVYACGLLHHIMLQRLLTDRLCNVQLLLPHLLLLPRLLLIPLTAHNNNNNKKFCAIYICVCSKQTATNQQTPTIRCHSLPDHLCGASNQIGNTACRSDRLTAYLLACLPARLLVCLSACVLATLR